MSDSSRTDVSARPLDVSARPPALPPWLARRFLRPGESVTWVCGPQFNPSCERYLTHPALFLAALAFAVACVAAGRLIVASWAEFPALIALPAGGVVIGSIIVLAIASGYFTRLVVTDCRLAVLQGYEVCRSWDLDDLPPRLLNYGRPGREDERAIDLEAVKTMLGSTTDRFTDSKTILAFAKQIERIRPRENDRP
jgi:hypothetical protein